jgi:hypothetical protein
MRVQRELYNTPHEVAVFPRPVLLDQVNTFLYYGQVVGSYVDSPDSTGFAILTDLYPFRYDEIAGRFTLSPPTSWDYIPSVVVLDLLEVAGTASVTPPTTWNYILTTRYIQDLGVEVAGVASIAPPTTWNYILTTRYIQDLGVEVAGVASIAPPTTWNYRLAIVIYNCGVEVAASASVAPPTDWSYYV